MRLTNQNYMKAVYAFLFVSSSISSYFHPHLIPIAGLSVLGFIAYDAINFFREKHKPMKDLQPEVTELQVQILSLQEQFKDIKNDQSIAKIGNVIRRG